MRQLRPSPCAHSLGYRQQSLALGIRSQNGLPSGSLGLGLMSDPEVSQSRTRPPPGFTRTKCGCNKPQQASTSQTGRSRPQQAATSCNKRRLHAVSRSVCWSGQAPLRVGPLPGCTGSSRNKPQQAATSRVVRTPGLGVEITPSHPTGAGPGPGAWAWALSWSGSPTPTGSKAMTPSR